MNKAVFLLVAVVLLAGSVSAITETVALEDYVIDFEYNANDVENGETFRITATITNEAGETRNDIELALELDDPFDNVGDDKKNIGSLADDESKSVSFRVEVDDDADSGDYDIEFDLTDNKGKDSDEFVVEVNSNVAELVIGDVTSFPSIIAPDVEDIRLNIILQNTGDKDAEFVRAKLILPEGFTPSGSYTDTFNAGTIFHGGEKSIEFFIDTAERVTSGTHKGILEIEYESDDDGMTDRLEFDLPVKGRPQFSITESSTEPTQLTAGADGKLKVTVTNIGEEEGEETSIRVFENSDQPFEFEEKTNYIGNLLPGESGTGTLSFTVDSGAVEKTYLVRMQVRTISEGNVLIEEMTVPVKVRPSEGGNFMIYIIVGAVVLVLFLVILVFRLTR